MNNLKRRYRQHGTGSVRKLGPEKWRIGYNISAPGLPRKQRFETIIGSKQEAAQRLRQRLEELHNGASFEDHRLTFSELCSRFLEAKKLSKEPTTHRLYQRVLSQHIIPAMGHLRAREIHASHIRSLLENARSKSRNNSKGSPLAGSTLRNIRVIVRAVFSFAVRQGILNRNVADLVEPPAAPFVERNVVTLETIRKIFEASRGTELEAIVPFALGTGLRRSEICALKWGDIDLETATIQVRRAAANLDRKVVIKATKTRKSQRTDYLAPFVTAVLRNHRKEQSKRHLALGVRHESGQGFVFDRYDGRSWDPNELSRMFCRLVRRHKLPSMRLHDLRHSYASLAFAAGVPLKVVSDSLGHANIGITAAIYVHLLDEAKREKSDRLDAYVSGALTTPLALVSGE